MIRVRASKDPLIEQQIAKLVIIQGQRGTLKHMDQSIISQYKKTTIVCTIIITNDRNANIFVFYKNVSISGVALNDNIQLA